LIICLLAKDFQRFKSIVAPHFGQGGGSAAEDDSSFAFIDTHPHSLLDNCIFSAHIINSCDVCFFADTCFAPEK
jgi:hypothetical protein